MNCRQATRLASEGLDRALANRERWSLRIHLLICTGCRNYHKQLLFIRNACQHLRIGDDEESAAEPQQAPAPEPGDQTR